jgi:DNA-directed RNA polymerase specialized sigma24 family protein
MKNKTLKGKAFEAAFISFLVCADHNDTRRRNKIFFNFIKPTVDEMLKNAFFKYGRSKASGLKPLCANDQKEISQEVFETILNKMTKAKLAEVKNLNKYLVTIVFNTVRMYFRKNNTYKKHIDSIQSHYEMNAEQYGAAFSEDEPVSDLDRELTDFRSNLNYDDPLSW